MKKIAIAVVLCASASFSPTLAQSALPPTKGTFSNLLTRITYDAEVTIDVSGRKLSVRAESITLNGAYIGPNGLAPNTATRLLSGATCTVSGMPLSAKVVCTK